MNREEIQANAILKLKEHNYNGVLALSMGSGKTYVAIQAIKEGKFKNILITSPRTNLKENWKKELIKWNVHPNLSTEDDYNYHWHGETYNRINITIENIQTCYKWTKERLQQFDLVVIDECHTISEKYIALIKNSSCSIIGLTGTPNKTNKFKQEVLYKELPIIFEYLTAEKDGIINKTQYWIYEYELSDNFKVIAGTKDKKWLVGEKTQYEYLERQCELGKNLMWSQGASDYFTQSFLWMRSGTPAQKEAGRKFFYAIKNRKEFLWNLDSSLSIALSLKSKILMPEYGKQSNNKVLLFSELTSQANRLSPYNIHSNVGSSIKETNSLNKLTLEKFNKGEIRELSSVKSLQLGLNLNGANYAIFESYNSGDTGAKQSGGRLGRLDLDSVANAIIIVPKGTQSEVWKDSAFAHIENTKIITNINEFII